MISERDPLEARSPNFVDFYIGQRIKLLRIAHHLLLNDAAELIGLTAQDFEDREAGKSRIHAAELFVLAKSFGVGMGEFFRDLGSPPKPFRDA
jgi:transcriptional regulator with XRE-family HTH domain